MQIEVGKIVDGKVTGITNFGAFVDIEGGVTGLVHISEVAVGFVKDINEHLKVGDSVKVKVVSVDEKGKVGLSIKQTITPKKSAPAQETKKSSSPEEFVWERKTDDINLSFEDKLSKFKQSSDERMHDLKRNIESKRGTNGKRSTSMY